MTKRPGLFLLASALLALPWLASARDPADDKNQKATRLRRPIALILLDDGKTLLAANRDSGTVSLLDTTSLKVVGETQVARRLSDLHASRDGSILLASDEATGEVIQLEYAKRTLRQKRRLKVGSGPVSVRISDDGRLATAALLWPRQLAILDLASMNPPTRIDLPFAPRKQLLVPNSTKLIVADSFGAHIAVVDLREKKLDRVYGVTTVHNIRGLALDHKGTHVLLSHQRLHAGGRPNRGDIQSGNLIDNELRRLRLSDILNPRIDPMRNDRVHPLGDIERGAGDPADVCETPDGMTIVAFAGVNEVALGYPDKATWTRLSVGPRPTALALDCKGNRVFVANTFGDSISVIDLKQLKVRAEIFLGERRAVLRPEERGEVLFFDAGLSMDGWFSCHSCHTDGHTNGRLNDNLTDGTFGTPKRVLSLLGVKETGPWAWNGKMPDLKSQIGHSLKSTMQGAKPPDEMLRDIEAFLDTLTPPASVATARGTIDAKLLERGRQVFTRQKCATCHKGPFYTTPRTYDVGLHDEAGLTRFNPPSLRGISQAGPYFHDNRARNLGDVFTVHRHRIPAGLSEADLEALLHFLKSL